MPRITDLPSATQINNTDTIPIVQGGTTMQVTRQLLAASPTYIYTPDGWNAGWLSAKAASGTTPAYMAFIGDSITQGLNSSDQMLKSFPYLIRTSLLNGATPYAEYYAPTYTSGTNAPYVYSNGSFGNGAFGSLNSSSNLAFSTTITTPYACTALDFWTFQGVAGTWQYAVDGGTVVPVTNTTTNIPFLRTQITGLSSATHTVLLNNQNIANALRFGGATYYPNGTSATGYGFAFNGVNGMSTVSFVYPNQNTEAWAGRVAHGGSTYSPVFPQAPHLVIMELGVNDCNSAAACPPSFTHIMRGWIQQFRRARANTSVLFVIPCYPNPDSSDTTNTFANPRSFIYYIDAMYSLARELNCAVVNFYAKWGDTPQGQGFIAGGSNVHPTDAGHADIANTILGIL